MNDRFADLHKDIVERVNAIGEMLESYFYEHKNNLVLEEQIMLSLLSTSFVTVAYVLSTEFQESKQQAQLFIQLIDLLETMEKISFKNKSLQDDFNIEELLKNLKTND